MPKNRIYYGKKGKRLKFMLSEQAKRSFRGRRGYRDGGGLSFS